MAYLVLTYTKEADGLYGQAKFKTREEAAEYVTKLMIHGVMCPIFTFPDDPEEAPELIGKVLGFPKVIEIHKVDDNDSEYELFMSFSKRHAT